MHTTLICQVTKYWLFMNKSQVCKFCSPLLTPVAFIINCVNQLRWSLQFGSTLLPNLSYLNRYGIISFGGTVSPNRSASLAILSKTLLTISPKYIPETSFSKIWNKTSIRNKCTKLVPTETFQYTNVIPWSQDSSFQHPRKHQIRWLERRRNWSYPTLC